MVRFLIRVGIFLASAALGLWAASWLLPDFRLHVLGFVTAVVVFALVQAILAPLVAKLVARYARSFLGGVGLIVTLLALAVATLVSDGLAISGIRTWILATLVVWLVTAAATAVLPALLLKKAVTGAAGAPAPEV